MGLAQGNSVGSAVGRVVIDTSQAERAPATMQGVAAGITTAMNNVNASVNRTQTGLGGLAGAARNVGAAFGLSLVAGAVVQLAKAAVAATDAATAYDRQRVAAVGLAGSVGELNELLDAYDKATGGAIDQATALADVTKLQAVGFADSAKELEQFTRAARGISVAMGSQQDYVISQLQLAIANQSTMRLDQLGLGVSEVKRRIDELKASNKGLTDEMAYQQAILGLAEQKFGKLADSAEAQATGVEKARKAWANYGQTFGQLIQTPVNAFFDAIAKGIDAQAQKIEDLISLIGQLQLGLRGLGINTGISIQETRFISGSAGRDRARHGRGSGPGIAPDDGSGAVKLDWAEAVTDLNQRTNDELTQQNADYHRQRADSESDYQKGLTREAQDFAIGRQRAEQDLADSIADIRSDGAQREQRMAEDLARTIAQAQADSAERMANLARDRDERIAEASDDARERLAELEEDYQRSRVKAAEDHRLRLLEAAGRLDARAVYMEERKYAQQEKDAKSAYDEQRDDVKEKLAEQLADINKAYEKQAEAEQRSLARSIAQQQAAHDRQLADARAADEQRIADMQADFAERIEQEDADRAIRLQRMAQDHQDQLAEMDRTHGERIGQIIRHAQEERTQLDEEAKKELTALGIRNEAWLKAQETKEEELEKLWNKFWGHLEKTLTDGVPPGAGGEDARPPGFATGGNVRTSGLAMVHQGEAILTSAHMAALRGRGLATPAQVVAAASGGGGNRDIRVGDINVNVAGSNSSAGDIANAVRYELYKVLEEVAA